MLADPLALRLYARDASMVEGRARSSHSPLDRRRRRVHRASPPSTASPVVPRGSGTGLAGGATPIGDALVIVTTKMNRILEVRPEDRLAWVEPGRAQPRPRDRARARSGFTTRRTRRAQQACSIGGNVSTNAGGPALPRRTASRARTCSRSTSCCPTAPSRALGSRGARGRRLRPARRASSGCEGTLGIVTARRASGSRRCPPAVRTMLLDFTTVEDVRRDGQRHHRRAAWCPAALEMMDHGIVVRRRGLRARGLPDRRRRDPARRGRRARRRRRRADRARSRPRRTANGVRTIRVAADDAERALLWKGRKSAFGAIARIAPNYYLHDCVVPRTQARRGARRRLRDRRAPRPDRHERVPRGRRQPASAARRSTAREPGVLERVLAAGDEIVRLCVDAGGVLSRRARHRPGEARLHAAACSRADDLDAQARLRDAFDPTGRMNPQKVLPAGARCGDYRGRAAGAQDAAAGGGDASRRAHGSDPSPHRRRDVAEALARRERRDGAGAS